MKKVNVIGYGTVGNAQEFLLKKLGHTVNVYDPYVLPESKLLLKADLTFICTPETVVEGVLENLIKEGVNGLYLIKSTVPLGTTRALMQKHKIHLCHNPEFLREKYSFQDVVNPSRLVIGECCSTHGDILEDLYKPLNSTMYRTDPTTSELIKLVSNSLRAVSISFWNEVYLLSDKVGADIQTIARAADPAKVIGEWEGGRWGTKFFGKPYAGKCLPKDLDHLINGFGIVGLNPLLFEAAREYNKQFRDEK